MKAFSKLRLLYRHQRSVLPAVDHELAHWRERAAAIPDPELRHQTLATLERKRFHCEAGGAYATLDLGWRDTLVPLIVALQTISDYLDDLCDRGSASGAEDFRALHRAMHDAVTPEGALADYYAIQPRADGGYLSSLVDTCRRHLASLPGYAAAWPYVAELVGHYAELQVHKHVAPERRVPALKDWLAKELVPAYPQLEWWELAAASGSTIGVYALFEAATDPMLTAEEAAQLAEAYFPTITGLHILLDYLIDQAEDEAIGELNFIACYDSMEQTTERLTGFVDRARTLAAGLPSAHAHELRVAGILGVYLDGADPVLAPNARRLVRRGGMWAWIVHRIWRRLTS